MTTGRIGWVDATGGLSGDMLLGACLDAGVPLGLVREAVAALGLPEQVGLTTEPVTRGGLGGLRARVATPPSSQHRGLSEIRSLLERADPEVAEAADRVFTALAHAEARVHRVPVERVHFHEVGALDAVVDVVAVVTALRSLRLHRLVCSPIALGSGRARSGHGPIPVPAPAVVELLRAAAAPGFGGPVDCELATPTGVALMVTLANGFGPLPALRPTAVGMGAGERDPDGHANLTRLVLGEPAAPGAEATAGVGLTTESVLEANVDDLDPRLWPGVLAELLAAGASDAWLTPILMKKGRPAHTLSVLADPALVGRLERLIFTRTSTIGLRRREVTKAALARTSLTVDVEGAPVRVKVARMGEVVVNAVPEYDDLARIAEQRGLPVKAVLDAARAAAQAQLTERRAVAREDEDG